MALARGDVNGGCRGVIPPDIIRGCLWRQCHPSESGQRSGGWWVQFYCQEL